MDSFLKRKQDILGKADKSTIGSWDKKIVALCEKINLSENYYTTSSCSGRVAIVKDTSERGHVFMFVSHSEISFEEIFEELTKILSSKIDSVDFRFKQEPVIMHVACRSVEYAQTLVDLAKQAGFKRSGIIASSKNIIVEIMGTEKLEFPIVHEGKIIVGEPFLQLVVKRSNENLKREWKKIEKLQELV